jgi:hypothetical protein
MLRLAPLIYLAACSASPMPGMGGAARSEATANGRAYTVWYTADRVEIVRHGWASPGEHQQIRADMIALIPQVTGCALSETTLTGDSGEMRAAIRC